MWSIRPPSVSGFLLGRDFWRVPERCQHHIDPTALQSFLIPLPPQTEWDRSKDIETGKKSFILTKLNIIRLWWQDFTSAPKCTFNKLLVSCNCSHLNCCGCSTVDLMELLFKCWNEWVGTHTYTCTHIYTKSAVHTCVPRSTGYQLHPLPTCEPHILPTLHPSVFFDTEAACLPPFLFFN